MPRWRPESVLLARVVAFALPLILVLWLVPLWLLHNQRQALVQRQAAQLGGLAAAAAEVVQARLSAVEALLAAGQEAPPQGRVAAQLNGLVRGLLMLRPGEERSFLAGDAEAPAELPLLLGAPRSADGQDWVLPVLRPAQTEGESPMVAALDPNRLLALPPMAGAGVLLLGGRQVLAASGELSGQLGQVIAVPQGEADGRVHALLPLGGTGLSILVSLPAVPAANEAWMLALLPLGGAILLLGTGWLVAHFRRLQSGMVSAQASAAMADARLQLAQARADAGGRQVEQVLAALDHGACLLDGQLRLVAWNDQFPTLAGVSPHVLRPGLTVSELQAVAGDRPETAIRAALRHRLTDMRDRRSGCAVRFRPDGSRVEDRWTTLEEGGLLLTCRMQSEPAGTAQPPAPPPQPPIAEHLAELCAEELRTRLPRLLRAVDAGDTANTRMEAHAMKGVAANFGLEDFANRLCGIEAAARAEQAGEMHRAAAALGEHLDIALDRLFSRVV